MIHCYSLFSFKTPLLVSFSVEVKREKTLTGCFSINRFFFLHCNSMTIKKLMNEKYIFDAACKTTLKKGPWNWHMPLSWTDCHFFYTQPLKKNLTLTTLNDHAWFSFFWEQSRKLMTSFNYVKDDPRNNNLLVSHARIKYSFFKGLLSTYLLDRKLI